MFAKGKAGEEMHDVRAALAGDSHCSKVAAGGAQPHRHSAAGTAQQTEPGKWIHADGRTGAVQ